MENERLHENEYLHGVAFSARINGTYLSGRISVHDGACFLCQDVFNGAPCPEKFGHKFSWHVGSLTKYDLENNGVSDFKLIDGSTLFTKTKFNIEDIVRIKGKSRDYEIFVIKDKEYWLKALNKKKIIGPIHEDQLELSNTQSKSANQDPLVEVMF